jgi:hypothetical protein
MLTFCNSYVLWLLRCVQLRLVTVTYCDINIAWCYVLSQYLISISNRWQATSTCFFWFYMYVLCVRSLCQANAACQFYKFYLIMDGITPQCFSCSICVSNVSGACVRPMLPVSSTSSPGAWMASHHSAFSYSIRVSYVSGACVRPMLPVSSTSSIWLWMAKHLSAFLVLYVCLMCQEPVSGQCCLSVLQVLLEHGWQAT